jgi:hypothetical protein
MLGAGWTGFYLYAAGMESSWSWAATEFLPSCTWPGLEAAVLLQTDVFNPIFGKNPAFSSKSALDLIKSGSDLIKSRSDFIKSRLDLINSCSDLIKSRSDLIKSGLDLIKSAPT